MAQKISQKEYLKKYLSKEVGEEKKKKKKKRPKEIKRKTVTVVDDDYDFSKMGHMDDDEIEAALMMTEDAPQVVGVIDDRPPELKALDYKNTKWKGLSETENEGKRSKDKPNRSSEDLSPKRIKRRDNRKRNESDDDLSPPRPGRSKNDTDLSSSRNRKNMKKDDDLSPKRRRGRRDSSDLSPNRIRRSMDLSPPRKRQSPRKIYKHGSPDLSPVRKNSKRSPEKSFKQSRRDSDLSPKRRDHERRRSTDRLQKKRSRWNDSGSPETADNRKARNYSPDLSPRRKPHSPSNSPPKRKRSPRGRSPDISPPRRRRSPDFSPPRRHFSPRKRQISESPPPTHRKHADVVKKSEQTMDGKKAGLQKADNLKIENEKYRQREAEMYEKMSSEMSGRNAEARVRATGAVDRRKLKEDLAKEKEREEKYKERKQVYDKWGKGLKQVEDYNSRLNEAAHEVNKPLARYANDEDLEVHLKEQERLGDPMLDYIRSKRKDKKIKERVPEKPMYKGLFPDNRFNIRPGYRWDGVDRSNGFEKRLFETINTRQATVEDAYKYSTEDM